MQKRYNNKQRFVYCPSATLKSLSELLQKKTSEEREDDKTKDKRKEKKRFGILRTRMFFAVGAYHHLHLHHRYRKYRNVAGSVYTAHYDCNDDGQRHQHEGINEAKMNARLSIQ